MDIHAVLQSAIPLLTALALKVVGAIILWIIGRQLINLARRLVVRSLKYPFDQTVATYIGTAVSVVLNIAEGGGRRSRRDKARYYTIARGSATEVAALLDVLTMRKLASPATVRAARRLAIRCVQMLTNVRTYVGNAKILGDNIQNFTAHPYRRVDLVAQLDNSVSHTEAIRLLKERLRRIPNVVADPVPDVEILTFTPLGPVLAVRPYCHNDHYWQVYFDTNRSIREVGGDANFPAPQQHVFVNGARA